MFTTNSCTRALCNVEANNEHTKQTKRGSTIKQQGIVVDDCTKDDGFIFYAKDNGKASVINKLSHSN